MGTTTAAADAIRSHLAIGDETLGATTNAVSPAVVSTPATRRAGPTTISTAVPVAIPAAVSGVPNTTSRPATEPTRPRRGDRSNRTEIASADIRVATKPA